MCEMSILCLLKMVWRCSYKLLILLLLLLLPLAHLKQSHTCTLYDPPSPGLHCFHGEEAERAVTESKWAWMLEMYSGWCGHCQKFAPKIKELGEEVEAWSHIIRVGLLECTGSDKNQETCGRMGVQAYPTMRFFRPHDPKPLNFKHKITGAKSISELRHMIVDHVTSIDPPPREWPNFDLLLDEIKHSKWSPSIFIFEKEGSYLGKELILDLSRLNSFRVRRVSANNRAMVHHYSILELPSVVVEAVKDHYHIMTKNSVSDKEFRGQVLQYVRGSNIKHASKSHVSSQEVVKDHQQIKQLPHTNRVDYRALLSTVSYALRHEVPVHSFISGSTYSTLVDFVSLLEQVLPKMVPGLELVARSLLDIKHKLEGNSMDGFITNKEWNRIINTKLSSEVFPIESTWRVCNGSQPHFRGYPCGLWMLMHTLTLHTLHSHPQDPSSPPIDSMRALNIIVSFITHFFTCEECRVHFSEMSHDVAVLGRDGGRAILWLWEAHNTVNARLYREGGGDPAQPKSLFPSISRCPYCYNPSRDMSHDRGGGVFELPDFNNTGFYAGESLLLKKVGDRKSGTVLRGQEVGGATSPYLFLWNRTAILLYMWNFYHLDPIHGNGTSKEVDMHLAVSGPSQHHLSHSSILQAAWPNTDHHSNKRGKPVPQGSKVTGVDPSTSILVYFACVFVLIMLGAWLMGKKHLRKHIPTSCNHRKLHKSFSKYFYRNNHLYIISL